MSKLSGINTDLSGKVGKYVFRQPPPGYHRQPGAPQAQGAAPLRAAAEHTIMAQKDQCLPHDSLIAWSNLLYFMNRVRESFYCQVAPVPAV